MTKVNRVLSYDPGGTRNTLLDTLGCKRSGLLLSHRSRLGNVGSCLAGLVPVSYYLTVNIVIKKICFTGSTDLSYDDLNKIISFLRLLDIEFGYHQLTVLFL